SESVLMSLIGGILGILLAKFLLIPAIVAGGSKTSLAVFLLNFKVTWQVFLGAFLVAVGIGVLAGFVPAIRSSRIKIVDGLRQVV
ncbi:MAG: FtsX-like permease family protein, partial [Acidobacteriota bacterium]